MLLSRLPDYSMNDHKELSSSAAFNDIGAPVGCCLTETLVLTHWSCFDCFLNDRLFNDWLWSSQDSIVGTHLNVFCEHSIATCRLRMHPERNACNEGTSGKIEVATSLQPTKRAWRTSKRGRRITHPNQPTGRISAPEWSTNRIRSKISRGFSD